MRIDSVFLAAALLTAPLGARAADLVVWWENGFYAQEDEAVREIITAFEQGSAKQVELTFHPQRELGVRIEAALEAGQPPDFAFGTLLMDYAGEWALDGRLLDLSDTIGPYLNLFDPEALRWVTLLNAKTGQNSLYGLPMGQYRQYIHVWKSLLERAGLPSMTSRRSGMRSGRSGARKCSPPCAGRRAARTSGASGFPCRPARWTRPTSSTGS